MDETKLIYIEDAKNSSQEEFVKNYNHPFLFRYAESGLFNLNKTLAEADVSVKQLDALLKNEPQEQELLDIIGVTKTIRNNNVGKITVGRVEIQDIVIDDLLVSKVHAYFQKDKDNQFSIIENGSTNGTFLNQVKLKPAVRNFVKDKDIISFGGIKYLFFMPETAYNSLKKQNI